MSRALASFIPLFADKLGVTQSSLYERQRALVRAGVMQSEGRRGPGSGVQTTAEAVAMLLISAMAGDSLSLAVDLTLVMVDAKSTEQTCGLTKYPRFVDALASLLIMEGRASKVEELRIDRTKRTAAIQYREKGSQKVSEFGVPPATITGVQVAASISSDTFRAIAAQVRQAVDLKADALDRGEE